jgi:beta-phosphoglucomutase-like phosphatase (HAD superfamily)
MNLPVTIDARAYDAVIFGLDGVVIDIMAVHARAWATLFDAFLRKRPLDPSEQHGSFTHDDYLHFIDGKPPHDAVADFLFARGISLRSGAPSDSDDDTVCGLVNQQQQLFRQLLGDAPSPRRSSGSAPPRNVPSSLIVPRPRWTGPATRDWGWSSASTG